MVWIVIGVPPGHKGRIGHHDHTHFIGQTPSRRPPASALPTISSDSPREYTSAVSTKLIPASSAAWMIRTESSWSVLPQSPNIIAPRQSGLTLTPVEPSSRSCMAAHLVDRREARLEAVARGTQVEPPHTRAFRSGQAGRLLDVLVESPRPVAQCLGVVVAEALHVMH